MHTDLTDLGDALERAARADLPMRRKHRRVAVGAAIAVLVPAAAVGATGLLSTEEQVAQGMPGGTLALAGTEPSCTVVVEDVEYHCVLARPPAAEWDDWKGAAEITVDQTRHVNGGCRALNSAGTEWRCYLGEAAVEQNIITADFLGEYVPTPLRG